MLFSACKKLIGLQKVVASVKYFAKAARRNERSMNVINDTFNLFDEVQIKSSYWKWYHFFKKETLKFDLNLNLNLKFAHEMFTY